MVDPFICGFFSIWPVELDGSIVTFDIKHSIEAMLGIVSEQGLGLRQCFLCSQVRC